MRDSELLAETEGELGEARPPLTTLVRLERVEKEFPGPDGKAVQALAPIDLEIARREQVALAGPSGSGKSTLLNILAGIILPSRGRVWVNGVAVDSLSESARDLFRGRSIGYVYQNFNLLSGFTALENVLLAMGFSRAGQKGHFQRAGELLERVGLGHRLRHRPAQLSSGEQQRVAIARALANQPPLLLADEPTASLDFWTGRMILELLLEVSYQAGATLVVASHDRDLLTRFGRVVEVGQL